MAVWCSAVPLVLIGPPIGPNSVSVLISAGVRFEVQDRVPHIEIGRGNSVAEGTIFALSPSPRLLTDHNTGMSWIQWDVPALINTNTSRPAHLTVAYGPATELPDLQDMAYNPPSPRHFWETLS